MKRAAIIVALFIVANLAGCVSVKNRQYDDRSELTDTEISILKETYNISDVKYENLLDNQINGLNQLRAGINYIETKYSSYDFDVVRFTPANAFNNWAELIIKPVGYDEEYQVNIDKAGDDYSCSDNFYGVIVRKDYDTYIEQLLNTTGFNCKCYTIFTELCGDEIGENTIANELAELNTSRTTYIFLETTNIDYTLSTLKELISDANIYGTYSIYFGCDLSLDISELMSIKQGYKYATFSIF